jgi:hypothetical protein
MKMSQRKNQKRKRSPRKNQKKRRNQRHSLKPLRKLLRTQTIPNQLLKKLPTRL